MSEPLTLTPEQLGPSHSINDVVHFDPTPEGLGALTMHYQYALAITPANLFEGGRKPRAEDIARRVASTGMPAWQMLEAFGDAFFFSGRPLLVGNNVRFDAANATQQGPDQNINDPVEIRLTDAGRSRVQPEKIQPNGTTRMSFWELARIVRLDRVSGQSSMIDNTFAFVADRPTHYGTL